MAEPSFGKVNVETMRLINDGEVTRRQVADARVADTRGKVNVYLCELCGSRTVTRDVHAGTTPYITSCNICGGPASSLFYRVPPGQVPTMEWYRPMSEVELQALAPINAATADHLMRGGLVLRLVGHLEPWDGVPFMHKVPALAAGNERIRQQLHISELDEARLAAEAALKHKPWQRSSSEARMVAALQQAEERAGLRSNPRGA